MSIIPHANLIIYQQVYYMNSNRTNKLIWNNYYKMSEFGITKIMDGIFISDSSLIMDPQFLITNKVNSVIGWSSNPVPLNMEEDGIKSMQLQFSNKRTQQNQFQPKLPNQNQLSAIFELIQQAKQQYLCCVIYSDYQSQAGIIACSYIMKKFNWDMNSSLNFIQIRFPNFSPRNSLVQQLISYEMSLIQKCAANLRSVTFSLDFLTLYKSEDSDESLLLNTIKNTLINQNQVFQQKKKPYSNKGRRIQWFDRVRPSSSTGNYNKFVLYNRGTSLKQNKMGNSLVNSMSSPMQNNWNIIDNNSSSKNLKPKQSNIFNNIKHKYLKRSSDVTFSLGQYFMDDLQFQSLKQMSRTNFNDSKFKGSLKKRGSLKISKQNVYKDKINNQNHRPSSGNKSICKNQKIDSQQFLQNLKNINKQKLGNLGINA